MQITSVFTVLIVLASPAILPAADGLRGNTQLTQAPHPAAAVFLSSTGALPLISAHPVAPAGQSCGVTLTPDEYAQFIDISKMSRAGAWDVGRTNMAVKGTNLLLVTVAWLLMNAGLRRIYSYFLDQYVCDKTWAATTLICVEAICTAWIIVAVVN